MTEFETRRGFLVGLSALISAPMIARAESLMPIKAIDVYDTRCLVVYDCWTDGLVLRIDRRLETMRRCQKGAVEVADSIGRNLLPAAFHLQPKAGVQRYMAMPVTMQELRAAGLNATHIIAGNGMIAAISPPCVLRRD